VSAEEAAASAATDDHAVKLQGLTAEFKKLAAKVDEHNALLETLRAKRQRLIAAQMAANVEHQNANTLHVDAKVRVTAAGDALEASKAKVAKLKSSAKETEQAVTKAKAAAAIASGQYEAAQKAQGPLSAANSWTPSFEVQDAKIKDSHAAYKLQTALHAKTEAEAAVAEASKHVNDDTARLTGAKKLSKTLADKVEKASSLEKVESGKAKDNDTKIKDTETARVELTAKLTKVDDEKQKATDAVSKAKQAAYAAHAAAQTSKLVADANAATVDVQEMAF
jgi:chromosome segregation ATPase